MYKLLKRIYRTLFVLVFIINILVVSSNNYISIYINKENRHFKPLFIWENNYNEWILVGHSVYTPQDSNNIVTVILFLDKRSIYTRVQWSNDFDISGHLLRSLGRGTCQLNIVYWLFVLYIICALLNYQVNPRWGGGDKSRQSDIGIYIQ